jgi:methylglutaconyl-CoA hydratase
VKPSTILTTQTQGTLTITLNRPEVHNAFTDQLITDLVDTFTNLENDPSITAVILTGAGKSFCAGADLNWMKEMVRYTKDQNIQDSNKILRLYDTIATCPKPVIGRINGPAFGGGVGLIAVCDLTASVPEAKFAFTEVKLGLAPAVISTYVSQRLSPATMRRYFITGERFDAATANTIGLIDTVAPLDTIDTVINNWLTQLKTSGPKAIAEVKHLIQTMLATDPEMYKAQTVDTIATLRTSPEGQEGMSAFLEKRKPKWSDH